MTYFSHTNISSSALVKSRLGTLYFSPDFIMLIKSRTGWAGHAARMGNLNRRVHLRHQGVAGKIILKCTLKKYSLRKWAGIMYFIILVGSNSWFLGTRYCIGSRMRWRISVSVERLSTAQTRILFHKFTY